MTLNYGRKYFERTLIFRPHNVYGPDMGWEHVIPQFILRMKSIIDEEKRNLSFPIQGSGNETRAFIYIDDFTAALMKIVENGKNLEVYNIGTGKGTSVLELVKTFESVNNVNLPYKIKDRRPGDLDTVYCNCDKANKELLWYAKKSIENICEDSYNFVKNTN